MCNSIYQLYLRKPFIPAWCAIPSIPHADVFRIHQSCNKTHCGLNDGIAIRCHPNYILVGYAELQCAGYGKWDNPVPKCEGKFICT